MMIHKVRKVVNPLNKKTLGTNIKNSPLSPFFLGFIVAMKKVLNYMKKPNIITPATTKIFLFRQKTWHAIIQTSCFVNSL